MNLALVGVPTFHVNGFLLVANELWGYSLAQAIDQRQVSISDLEKFLICLSGFQLGVPQTAVAEHILEFVELSWLAEGEGEDLELALNYLPGVRRLVVPGKKRHSAAVYWQASLRTCLQAARAKSNYPAAVQPFFAALWIELDAHRLLFTTQFSSHTSLVTR